MLPLTIALKSQVPTKQKIILSSVFSLSLIITVISIVRFALCSPSRGTAGPSWLQAWSAIEQSVSVSVACLASFRTLIISNGRSSEQSPYRHYAKTRHAADARALNFRFPHLRSQSSGYTDIELLHPEPVKTLPKHTAGVGEEGMQEASGGAQNI